MTFLRSKSLLFAFTLALTTSHCANESSEEERQREDIDRQFNRINNASGKFAGFVITDTGETPIEVGIEARRNPKGNKQTPSLILTMKLGLFGGIKLTTENTSYDSGTGEFFGSFSKQGNALNLQGSSGSVLEFRAKIKNEKISEALLRGTNNEYQVEVSTETKSLLLSQESYEMWLDYEGKEISLAKLNIKKEPTTTSAPVSSDLPSLPGLSASIHFVGFGITPQKSQALRYDPLDGSFEIDVSGTATLVFENVYASSRQNPQPTVLSGFALVDGEKKGSISLRAKALNLKSKKLEFPDHTFVGNYQGIKAPFGHDSIAKMRYHGSSISNPQEMIFPRIPLLSLKHTVCYKNKPVKPRVLQATAIDYLEQIIYFSELNSNDTLELRYDITWINVSGVYSDRSAHSSDLSAKTTLEAIDNDEFGCEDFE